MHACRGFQNACNVTETLFSLEAFNGTADIFELEEYDAVTPGAATTQEAAALYQVVHHVWWAFKLQCRLHAGEQLQRTHDTAKNTEQSWMPGVPHCVAFDSVACRHQLPFVVIEFDWKTFMKRHSIEYHLTRPWWPQKVSLRNTGSHALLSLVRTLSSPSGSGFCCYALLSFVYCLWALQTVSPCFSWGENISWPWIVLHIFFSWFFRV